MLSASRKRTVPNSPGLDLAWTNRLVCADNESCLEEWVGEFKGQVDLIYVDPPFATGSDFAAKVPVGEAKTTASIPVYRDRWARGMPEYLDMLDRRLRLMRELLSARGSLYVHVDYRAAARVRCLLDERFGERSLVNEIVWFYRTGGMPERLGFGRKHDTILFYAKDPARAIWNPQKEKSYLTHRYGFSNVEIHEDERGPYTWVNCRDVFDIPALRGNQPERVDFPTQKPEALLERIVLASSAPGSIVADVFCGSGTTLAVAERLGRRWLGCDASAFAVHTTRKRLAARGVVGGYEVTGEARADYVIEALLHRSGSEARVELLGVAPRESDPVPARVRALFGRWSDRVDWWGVEVAGPSAPVPVWHTQRSRQRRRLELLSEPFEIAPSAVLRVTVVDLLGHHASVDLLP